MNVIHCYKHFMISFFQVGRLEVEEDLYTKLKMDTNPIEIPDCKVSMELFISKISISVLVRDSKL